MKRFLAMLILLSVLIPNLLSIQIIINEIEDTETNSFNEWDELHNQYETKLKGLEILDIISDKYINKMNELSMVDDKHKWYIEYKDLIEEYSQYYEDTPLTIYDCFSTDELDLLFRVVQAEVGDEYGFKEKANVASVIFNRYYHEEFDANTLFDILTSQFSCISDGRYLEVFVSNTTILACEYAFEIEDTTGGCVAFRSDYNPEKWCKWGYIFQDDAHYFYK